MNPSQLEFSQGTLILRGWVVKAVKAVFGSDLWQWDHRINAWRCPAFQYARVRDALDLRAAGETIDRVSQFPPVVLGQIALPALRLEQQAAMDAWFATGPHGGVIVMPTGTGKTEVALSIMERLRCTALIVAPIRDLMYQWQRRILRSLGYDAGIIGDSLFNVKPISVTTYDSACIQMPVLGNQFQLIVFDECHHLPSSMRRDAARMSIACNRLGLTATPERTDGKHRDLEELIGPVVFRLHIEEVRGKSLADYHVFRIAVNLNPREQRLYDKLAKQVSSYVYERRKEDAAFEWSQLCADSANDPAARQAMSAYRQKQSIEEHAEEKNRVLEDLFRLHAGSQLSYSPVAIAWHERSVVGS